jgi:hypothetical protein
LRGGESSGQACPCLPTISRAFCGRSRPRRRLSPSLTCFFESSFIRRGQRRALSFDRCESTTIAITGTRLTTPYSLPFTIPDFTIRKLDSNLFSTVSLQHFSRDLLFRCTVSFFTYCAPHRHMPPTSRSCASAAYHCLLNCNQRENSNCVPLHITYPL